MIYEKGVKTSVLGLNRSGEGVSTLDTNIFQSVYNIEKVNPWRDSKLFLNPRTFLTFLKDVTSMGVAGRMGYKQIAANVARKMKYEGVIKNHEVVHVNYLNWSNCMMVRAASKDQKIIVSFLGSDLLCKYGSKRYKVQKEAIEKADVITVHHNLMRQVLLSKFGRKINHKVVEVLFGVPPNRVHKLDNCNMEKNVPNKLDNINEKSIVQVGYNAYKDQNHIDVVKSISKSKVGRDKIHIVIPLTYGRESLSYIESIKCELKKSKFEYTLIHGYMTDREVAALHKAVDVFIIARNTDALNNALTEHLHSGSRVIAGQWLPYNVLQREGADISTISSIGQVGECLNEELKNLSKGNYLPESSYMVNTIDQWEKIYKQT
ncbi:hypothetical protein [Salinibacter sp.]|uniref:hypothetical protein n=1 Tax=Salinibacter sp. TaxID=2065818 RepID=UPI0021E778F2|nr:hypothetical protein [Salinibacter sp.]